VKLIVAEKPQVARDLARVLGVPARGKGAFRGDRHVITWCIGHLVELEEPAAYDPAWRRWRLETLPMIPERFALRPSRRTAAQWRVVRDLLRSREFDEVVNACDAGREGELIFRGCLDLAGARPASVTRLWVSSLTDAALRAGLAARAPASRFDALADAARCRAEADWLVGMNATRALTVHAGGRARLLSVGRVQTPTLALVVAREAAIRAFVPERYAEVVGTFTTGAGARFEATWTREGETRLAPAQAEAIVGRDAPAPARVTSVDARIERQPPPLLFDLTSLQQTANRKHGMSAKRTLAAAQALYERHKLLSYPRTDSRHLPADVRGEVPGLLDALEAQPALAALARAARAGAAGPLPRVFDDRRVGDHHAIIPTPRVAPLDRLGADERRVYELVARRFLAAFLPPAEIRHVEVAVTVLAAAGPGEAPPPPDLYLARGKVRLAAGWHAALELPFEDRPLPTVAIGEPVRGEYARVEKQTEPPRRFSEATLLAAMESAGKEIRDEELRLAMKEQGLGTAATRAEIIETLLERKYLAREGKALVPTPLGVELVARVPVPSLASAELTGRWEARLSRMARGGEAREAFMRDIAAYVREIVDAVRARPAPPREAAPVAPPIGVCPRCGGAVSEKFKFFECAGKDFKLWKRIAGKAISPALAALLLRTRRTRKLPGFRSKAGKRFSAALVLEEGGEVKLDFG
jgi:DNA topoisomerase-3